MSPSSGEESKQRLCTRSSFQIPNVFKVPIYSADRPFIFSEHVLSTRAWAGRKREGREGGEGMGQVVQRARGGEDLGGYPRQGRALEGCGQREERPESGFPLAAAGEYLSSPSLALAA